MTKEERLAKFEEMLAGIQAQQQTLNAQVEALRAAGKEKTYRYRELLGQRGFNQQLLNQFKIYGLL